MKSAIRRQLKFRVTSELSSRVKKYCAAHNITETALMRTALEQYLTGTTSQSVLMRRLDLLGLELQRLVAGIELLGEAFGTFVRLWFAHNPEIGDGHKGTARRDASRRYRFFVQHVVRAIGDGDTLLARLAGSGEPLTDADELERVRGQEQLRGAEPRTDFPRVQESP
jgi:hypothetical protein